MLRLQAEGLGDIVAVPEPLCSEAGEAISAWNFCGGYELDRLRLFDELHGLDDVELTIQLMMVIRDHTNGH